MDETFEVWKRRFQPSYTDLNRPSLTERQDSKSENRSRPYQNSKRHPSSSEFPTLGRSTSGTLAPINTNVPNTSGASSAFGLGSGAFASFGASAKAPKTAGAAPEIKNLPAQSYEADKPTKSARRTIPTAKKVAEDSSDDDDPQRWSLKYTWVLFYRPPTGKTQDYEKSIKPLCRISSAQDFWRVYSHLKRPSALPIVSDYHIFKDGIRPVWEDDENKQGGKWVLRLKKGVIDRYWEDLLLAVVGDQFAEAGEEVCGMVVSIRNGEDVLNIWTKYNGGRNIKIRETIKRALNLPTETNLIFKTHDDSIAQRTAIDQARHEKNASEKRRHTGTESINKEGR